jgi:phosphoglycerol transferase MdoB-like AlkP superfamily enzyme
MVFALSLMAGFGTVMAAESFDKSIHNSRELANVVDSRLIVAIPYIVTTKERLRRKYRLALLFGVFAVFVLAAILFALYHGLSFDLSRWVDRSWIEKLTHLSK